MVNKKGREEASAGVRRITKRIFEFYALLATQFSLRRRRFRGQGARRYVPINVTALTALFICPFIFKNLDLVFQRVSLRAFCPSRFSW